MRRQQESLIEPFDGERRSPNGRQGGRFRRLVEEAPDGVLILGPDLTIRYASPAAGRALGCEPGRVSGTAFPAYLHPEERGWTDDPVPGDPKREGVRVPPELRLRHTDGSYRLFETGSVDLRGDPDVGGLALYLRDVTEERALREQLVHLSFHDPLTGLPNRALFLDRLEHALARTVRHRDPITVLFVDVDDFKAVNDWFGHEVGDMVLRAIGHRLQSCVRPGDTVARFGGDEFAILLENSTSPTGMVRAMERITQASRAPVAVLGHTLFVTVSIGAAASEPGRDGPGDVIRRADTAMYRAKRDGKGSFEMFGAEASAPPPGSRPFGEALRTALERGELSVHYQPEVALASGEIVGMEALLRWRYPRRDPVPVRELLALAGANGMLDAVGRWVLEEACRQASIWQDRFPGGPPLVSVNLCAEQLRQPNLEDEISAVLNETGLDPRNLALEVEGSATSGAPRVAATVGRLKDLGIGLVVEDFGRGTSSFSCLQQLSADKLKIDRRFIGELGREEGKKTKLMPAMTGFARAMGIRAVAKGVETARQAESLRGMGCDLAQGFYFWRPMPGDAATELLDVNRAS